MLGCIKNSLAVMLNIAYRDNIYIYSWRVNNIFKKVEIYISWREANIVLGYIKDSSRGGGCWGAIFNVFLKA